ncbi:MAG: c-type cytochrome [Verrucomicrobiaceae bacterium]|nr:MAG: c-type cytochrome [Verrucomicrobiaceae bacterium]
MVQALHSNQLSTTDLDGGTLDKLQAVLGDDPVLTALMQRIVGLFRPVLLLDGSDRAYSDVDITLDGPFTVETWVRLEPGINNEDGILGSSGSLDMNFYDSKFRVWVGGGINDAIVARRPIVPNVWTHIAVTRDEDGKFRIYQDGQLDSDISKSAPQKFEKLRIGWTGAKGGTAGALDEFRIWGRARNADEIVKTFDRGFDDAARPSELLFVANGTHPWGKPSGGARVAKTMDFPPLLTAAEAASLDAKFARLRGLAEMPGNVERGRSLAAMCRACHLIQGTGSNIGPNLSSAGAMGTEALLRNILTPNAAMEPGYRIYRVTMKTGEIHEGFLVSDYKDAVVLRVPGTEDRRINRREIAQETFLRRSLMPEGLLDAMQPQDVSDLFAYLMTLR